MTLFTYPYWHTEHWIFIAVSFLLPIVLYRWTINKSGDFKIIFGKLLGYLLLINWLVYQGFRVHSGYWSVQYDLPLELCNWAVFLTSAALISRKKMLAELAYFWVMSASVHGIFTPDIHEPFPHLTYLTFVVGHGGLVIGVLYLVTTLELKPRRGSWLKAFWWMQVYAAVALLFDWILNGNYGYLMSKPEGGSFLDLFPSWPWYILCMQAMALLSFILVYLPFYKKNGGL
jgi:hypothetical integral membrane protein (TIGR02206 family)